MSKFAKWFIGIVAVFGTGLVLGNALLPEPAPISTSLPRVEATRTTVPKSITPATTPLLPTQVPLSNNNYYINVDGDEVHSPAHSNAIPIGASAQCRDGTYSFSQHRSGTCSHHGGVAVWL